MFKLEMIKIR